MGLGDLLNVSSNALKAHQSQINTYSNNIANVNTEGYSRRTQSLSSASSYNGLGMGVQVGDVTRYYNAIGTTALLQEQSSSSYHTELAGYLTQLDGLVGSGSGELDAAMQGFQNALQDVIANPEDLAARTVLLQKSSSLATEFNQADSYVQGVAIGDNPVLGSTSDIVDDINTITERLQALNDDITKAKVMNRSVPDLLDERDALVRELSTQVDIDVSPDYTIRIGNQEVVSSDGQTRNEMVWVDMNTFTINGSDVSSVITGGKLAALVNVQSTAATMRSELDVLASTLITQANAIFDSAYNLNGATPSSQGYTLFTGSYAEQMAVDTTLYDPTNILSARPDLVAVAGTANSGDNTAAQSLYDLLQTEQSSWSGESISTRWTQIEATLGGAIREAEQLGETSTKVVNMLDGQMQSVSGVNLDEELISLTTAQHAYEAAARVMSTANDLLEVLINQTR